MLPGYHHDSDYEYLSKNADLREADFLRASMRRGLFNLSTSSTWQTEGLFELGVDPQLGNTGYADYRLDDLTIDSTGVVLPSSIIGSINDANYWLGYFALELCLETSRMSRLSVPSVVWWRRKMRFLVIAMDILRERIAVSFVAEFSIEHTLI